MKRELQGTSIKSNRFPFPIYFWIIFLIAIIGILDSIYLSRSHYRVHTDFSYMSFCAISKAFNCDTVSQSQYAVFLGVPLAVWGGVGYAWFICLLFAAKKQVPHGQRLWPSLFLLALLYSLISILLAAISSFQIKSYCLMCILSFGVNFMLLYFVWLVHQRFDPSGLMHALTMDFQFWKKNAIVAGSVALVTLSVFVILIGFFPKYWDYSTAFIADTKTGITDDGHPWIGASDPVYTVTEFTDYQCFQCKKMHSYLRLIVAQNPEKIRLVHRHFPMDHTINPLVKKPYHVGSGKMALLAIYATTKGKFWEMNDILFNAAQEHDAINIKIISDKVGLDLSDITNQEVSKNILEVLKSDINDGISLGIVGTPGYLINGKVYSGNIPTEIIKKISKY